MTLAARRTRIWVIAVILGLAVPGLGRSQPLTGTYTIGGASSDFASFTAAVTALTSNGVSGPVTFNVRAGTYTERVVIPVITGATDTSTITFRSETGVASDVTLQYAPSGGGDNSVIALKGASHVRIENMTITSSGVGILYRAVIVLDDTSGTTSDVVIRGNSLNGLSNAPIGPFSALIEGAVGLLTSNLTISHNTFNNGGYGVYLLAGRVAPSIGTVIRANTFTGCADGIGAVNHAAVVIDSNIVTVPSDGIYMQACSGSLSVQHNKVVSTAGGNGISLVNCLGDALNEGLVANNFVSIQGTSGQHGIDLQSSSYQNIYYNSVNVTTSGSGIGFSQTGGTNLNIVNNVFSNTSGSYAYSVTSPGGITVSDHNALYGAGMVFLARWGSTDCISLAALQAASGMDAHSVSANPDFVSATDLHANSPWLDDSGIPIAALTTDIDGNARNGSTPDIGASEFTSSLTKIPGGTYTIGGGSPTYATFAAAVSDLVARGISGPVTLNARPGTYAEQIDLTPVGGVSAANTITFQSETSGAVIQFPTTRPESNFVMRLNSASHVRVKNMTLVSSGSNSLYRNVLVLNGSLEDILVQGDSLSGWSTTGNVSQGLALISGLSSWTRNVAFRGNTLSAGTYGIYLLGYGNVADSGTVIKGNTFAGGYGGIMLISQPGVVVDSNALGVVNDGIDLNQCPASVSIQGNRVVAGSGGSCIALNFCQGDALDYGLIANNFMTVVGTTGGTGITMGSSSYENIYYNSVNISTSGTGYGIYLGSGSNVNIVNNVFCNTGGSYAYYASAPGTIARSDYNALYGAGMVFLAHWGTTECVSLAALQAASGMEAHSVSADPDFVSATDLHANSPWLDATAIPLAGVTTDIDGRARNATTPDIGASEFTSTLTRIPGGTYTIGGSSPTYATFTGAARDLVARGITGPVTLNVRAGTYVEQVDIPPVGGVNTARTVTFQSESSGAVLQYAQSDSSAATNWVMRLNSASHVHIRNLTMISAGLSTTYRNVLVLNGSIEDLLVQGDSMSGAYDPGGYQATAMIAGTNVWTRGMTILGNRFGPSSYGASISGYGNTADSGTVVRGNSFAGSWGAVLLVNQPAVLVDSNRATTTSDGINLQYCTGPIRVVRNRIVRSSGGGCILLFSCEGDALAYGIVANNFFSVIGVNGINGINLESSSNQNIFYNSVNVTGTGISECLYVMGGTSINVENNIFENSGGGYAYYIATPSSVTYSDYNDLFTTGAQLARVTGSDYATLGALQSGISMETHSSSKAAIFVSATDLHLTGTSLGDGALRGTPLVAVTTDIDGASRSVTAPYMGANEGAVILAGLAGPTAGPNGIERAPLVFQLSQNFPNPFNPSTTVKFSVEKAGRAVMKLYDVAGREVATLFDDMVDPGLYYSIVFNGNRLASGVYFYRLESGTQVALRKWILLK